ncbi:4Fe-4S dicluster domain [Rubrobacter radiotolerans]|uniref:4Fe-4S dicluster domain n=2 Tax=Rubrobacteraceae TaxID=84997 RepID=A0A023X5U6_RUBRA|nr:4Fe-4S dicluster domain-containing protein [Rubrobacter radiotolerans]AHY47852.1 4Fe-4S dicluster domain [Rubrobacter radiotolerans]MDX5892491.1 4Fe-4S dicluster domain-containing protein [Rubrobacter radiotolerans]SMC07782.1 formate dehydrogenase iron-sulfur subunit [Rubrobacter radiotolerans DSM 5868]
MATGFLTDTTVCIGCKACEVACKQWNQLPADGYELTGDSYDNTKTLSGSTWRHVAFIEKPKSEERRRRLTGDVDLVALAEDVRDELPGGAEIDGLGRWTFMSDVCKHCVEAPCQQACPTGAIIRNEFDNVYIQPDVCNGCGYCVIACPYGVITNVPEDGRAFKCTLCYDRQIDGLEPACAKSCPTNSIMFGEVEELERIAEERVRQLHDRGYPNAYLYGTPEVGGTGGIGGNHSKFILMDTPETYNLPEAPHLPQAVVGKATLASAAAAVALGAAVAWAFGGGE